MSSFLRSSTEWSTYYSFNKRFFHYLGDYRHNRAELRQATAQFSARCPWSGESGTDTILDLAYAPVITGDPGSRAAGLSATRKIETRRRYLRSRLDQLTDEMCTIEQSWGIERWKPEDHLYQKALEYIATRRYQRALGKLQCLVIQHLFELHKLNLAQTGMLVPKNPSKWHTNLTAGYKARTYLAKNLQRRCRAIRNAVNEYNAAARAMEPPRPAVDWERVSHYTFIEEFSLLQDTRNDLSQKAWARPEVRETMRMARRLDRAHEEITNANREIRRLHTSIRDEEIAFTKILAELRAKRERHFGAVEEFILRRRAANARNMAYIEHIHTLDGYTGERTPGRRAGMPDAIDNDNWPMGDISHAAEESEDAMVEGGLEEDDYASNEVTGMLEYLAGLTM